MKRFILSFLFSLCILVSFAQDKASGLQLNAVAPDFSATNQNNKEVSLKELKTQGPVVIVFYRGSWCPYCTKELKALQDSLSFITAKGASVVAISPQATEGVEKTVVQTGASFELLQDKNAVIAKAYDVSYEVDEKTRTTYLDKWNVDFLKINEQVGKATLPVPAVYIINKEGKIIYRFFDKNITRRPSVQELIDHLPK